MALTATAGSDSKRVLIVGIVIAMHAAGYYVIESGLSRAIIELVAPPVETKIIEENKPPEDLPPPPPPPDIVEPPPFIPPPDIPIQIQTQATNAITAVTNERPVAPPPPPKPAPVAEVPVTKAGFDPKRPIRSNEDYYPSASIRAGEEGVTTVDIYVAADGKVTDARVKTSSGFERLDEATLKYVKTWRMKPATRGGVPEGSWVTVPVRWKIVGR
ncbi:MAG: energy transducer TonB [Steroidobacteraceae bacterium]